MTPRPVDTPHSEFEPALEHARAGRFPEALAQVSRRLGPSPEGVRVTAAGTALLQVARLAEAAGNPAAMLEALDAAIACRDDWADLHFLRAMACLALSRRAEARAALDRALRVNPRYVAARVERALLDAREGLVGEALDALRALAAETRVPEPRAFEQGLESLGGADWEEAGALLRRALRLAEPDLERRLERFRALMDEGEPGRAAQVLREALPRHAAYPDLHYLLGTAELRQGHLDDALVSLAGALELHPDFHAARLHFARALEAAGARAQALEQVTLVLQCDPEHPDARALEAQWGPHAHRPGSREKRARKAP
jgi:tetratricopeptide (TPR) repeat protein